MKETALYERKLTDEQREALHQQKQWTQRKRKQNRENRKQKRLLCDLNKPKRPMNAFLLFIAEQQKLSKSEAKGNQVTLCRSKWKEMSDVDKKPYFKAAADLMEQFL